MPYDDYQTCIYCGNDMTTGLDSPGVTNHITPNGGIDYHADADHVAVAEE